MSSESRMDYDHRKEKEKSSGVPGPVHPDVRFKEIPGCVVLSNIVKPSRLITMPQRWRSRADFTFTLSEEQFWMVRNSRNNDDLLKRYRVLLRFCLLEKTSHQKDCLPPNLTVQINRHVAPLPRQKNRPIDITMFCRISVVTCNKLEVSWVAKHVKNYAACVNIVGPHSSENLLQCLKRKVIRNADHSKALIKEKFARDPDSEIATTSLKVSLLCPLGTMRMNVPVRPITCTHVQCFDAMLFLQLNEKKSTWVCPVCNKPAAFLDLFIDGLFTEILDATEEREILFLEDGTWQPVHPKLECYNLCTPCKSAKPVHPQLECYNLCTPCTIEKPVHPQLECYNLCTPCTNSNTIACDFSNSPNSSPTVNGGEWKRNEPIVIDLTGLDDSYEIEKDESAHSRSQRKGTDREQDEIQYIACLPHPHQR